MSAAQGWVTAPITISRRDFSQHAPTLRLGLSQQSKRDGFGRLRSEDQRAGLEDRANDRRFGEIHIARRRESDFGWRGDADVMAFYHFVFGHKAVEKGVGVWIRWTADFMPVTSPSDAHICHLIRSGESDHAAGAED